MFEPISVLHNSQLNRIPTILRNPTHAPLLDIVVE
jgi:hypothetical protein